MLVLPAAHRTSSLRAREDRSDELSVAVIVHSGSGEASVGIATPTTISPSPEELPNGSSTSKSIVPGTSRSAEPSMTTSRFRSSRSI